METFNNANMISHIGGALHAIVLGEKFNTATATTWPPSSHLSYQDSLQTRLYPARCNFPLLLPNVLILHQLWQFNKEEKILIKAFTACYGSGQSSCTKECLDCIRKI